MSGKYAWLDRHFSGLGMLELVIAWFVVAVFLCAILGIIETGM